MAMMNKIFEAINFRFFNYPMPANQQKGNTFFLENALTWFNESVTETGMYASKYSMLWERYFSPLPENEASWIRTLMKVKKHHPTIYEKYFGQKNIESKIAEWLLTIQRPDGTFPTSFEDLNNQPPGIFVNGRILSGLLTYYELHKSEKILSSLLKNAQWLLNMQMQEGSWQHYNFNVPHSNTMTAYSLIKLGHSINDNSFIDAGIKNIQYTISQQAQNGYFPDKPGKRTDHYSDIIAFTLLGILLSSKKLNNLSFIPFVEKGFKPLQELIKKDGYLPGEINDEFRTTVNYCCLRGNCLLSSVGFGLYELTKNNSYKISAERLLQYVKEKQMRSRHSYLNGGITGSWPISGKYNTYEIHSSAVRNFTHALLEEDQINTMPV